MEKKRISCLNLPKISRPRILTNVIANGLIESVREKIGVYTRNLGRSYRISHMIV